MLSVGSIVRKIAGLPEPVEKEKGEGASASTPDEEPRPTNPWESASATLRSQTAVPRSTAPSSSGPRTPWTQHEESKGAVAARRFGRGLAWAVLLLMAFIGVRSLFIPSKAHISEPKPAATGPAYPVAEAQSVAARFAMAYLGWDESKAAQRTAQLTSVLADGSDTTMGWDGHGRQDVIAVEPGEVTPGDKHQARVRVDALVRPAAPQTDSKDKPAEPDARWVGLDVPVVETSGRVIVTGRPGVVGIPARGPKAPDLGVPKGDTELTAATESVVRRFMGLYPGGDTEAVTAPGAEVPPLPGDMRFKSLDSWALDDGGSGTDRTGSASVTWTIGGASITQTYRVQLARVSSGDAQRWQVAAVRGGSL